MPIDYKKWDHIEVSDDEDDTHPNIDTPSLFKWRHEARVQRMEEMKNKTDSVENEKRENRTLPNQPWQANENPIGTIVGVT